MESWDVVLKVDGRLQELPGVGTGAEDDRTYCGLLKIRAVLYCLLPLEKS